MQPADRDVVQYFTVPDSAATAGDFFADIKKRIHEATPEQVQDLIRSGDVQLGDVREKDEWNAGHIPGAVHVPKSYLEQWAEDRLPEKDKTTIGLYFSKKSATVARGRSGKTIQPEVSPRGA